MVPGLIIFLGTIWLILIAISLAMKKAGIKSKTLDEFLKNLKRFIVDLFRKLKVNLIKYSRVRSIIISVKDFSLVLYKKAKQCKYF